MDRDRWIAISKNIENKNWFAAEVHMYEFEEPNMVERDSLPYEK